MEQCFDCDRRCNTFQMFANFRDNCPNFLVTKVRMSGEEIARIVGISERTFFRALKWNAKKKRLLDRLANRGYTLVIEPNGNRSTFFLTRR